MYPLPMAVAPLTALEKQALKLRKIFDDFMVVDKKPKPVRLTATQKRKAERISAVIKAHFPNGHHKAIAYLSAEILGIDPKAFAMNTPASQELPDIPKLYWDNNVPKYTAIYSLSNDANVRADEVVFMYDTDSNHVLDSTLNVLNDDSFDLDRDVYGGSWRFATPDEIKAAIKIMKAHVANRTGGSSVGW